MRKALVSGLLSVCIAACSGEGGDSDAQSSELLDDFKGCPADIPAFGPGLRAEGAPHSVRLLSAQPAEPERYENDWTVELSPADAVLLRGQTFMPIHGHDGRIEPVMVPLEQPGRFAIERLNFTMRGPWEVRLWVSSPGAPEELVVFDVCVAK